jgi:NADPH:quinone reductase-like Zn-dependent oxidoreductase
MLSLRSRHQGGPDGLALEDAPVPVPGTGDLLVEVGAAGYTPGELEWPSTWVDRSGHDRLPVIPCYEVSGVVAGLGWGTSGFNVGDRVFGLIDWYRDGAAASFVAAEARNLALAPKSIDAVTSAALPMTGLTAMQGLFRHGGLMSGERVLILGAAGAVGDVAVQLAKSAGAIVIGAARRSERERVMELGADEFLVIEEGQLGGVRGVDLVFDTVGESLVDLTWELIEPSGRVVSVAYQAQAPGHREDIQVTYFVVEPDRNELAEVAERVDAGDLRAPAYVVTPLQKARDVLIAKSRGETHGKIVIRVASDVST